MSTLDLVNAALTGDKEAFTAAFNNEIGARVTDALEVKKVELASSLINAEEENEVEATQVEIDGSADGAAEASVDVESAQG